jgi:hypothetical protein
MNTSQTTSWNDVRTAFKKIWGYDDFRPPQGEIIRSLLEKQDALIVMPTGGGKVDLFSTPSTSTNRLNVGDFAPSGIDGESGTGITSAEVASRPFA